MIRTSAVFGRGGTAQKGGSFVERILDQARAGRPLRVVSDQTFSPTFARSWPRRSVALAKSPAAGLLHVTNEGCLFVGTSWRWRRSLAAGLDAPVAAYRRLGAEAPRRAARRSWVLDTSRYRGLGLTRPRRWGDALAELVSAQRS